MKKQTFLEMILLLGVMLFGTACTGTQEISTEQPYTVGLVTKSGTSEYWMSLCEGAEAAADDYGLEILILQPDAETNKEAQIKMMETLVKKKVDMIAVSPISSESGGEYLDAAEKSGIPVISYDDGFDSQEIPYIGIDNVKAGYELMKYLAEQMGHKGQVGIISGPLTQKCHRLRKEGAEKYLQEEPDMTLAYVESGYSNLQMKEEDVSRLQQEYPEVEGVMVTSAATAMGFADAVADHGMKIVSVDAQTDAVEALRTGKIAALTAQSGYVMGYETIRYIAEIKNGETEDTRRILDAQMLTQANVGDYVQPGRNDRGEESCG